MMHNREEWMMHHWEDLMREKLSATMIERPDKEAMTKVSRIKEKINVILFGLMFLTYSWKRDIKEWFKFKD